MENIKYQTVKEYLETLSGDIREKIEKLRSIIKEVIPNAEEVISYNMPAFKQNGIVVYYAANKEHLGFYPTASPMIRFQDELKDFKTSKGAVQFPYKKELPVELIQRMVVFRVSEIEQKELTRKRK